ncbi:MAG: polysaccharide biosynthesis/export family protein [Polyangiaceae bacterium]|nr:polysaccharide biosynthesis/export family protein [Polyangiaceae bacterium]NUQ73945.1 polysaccharide biosynthesis/export family protein [Polyangiaceae bacterium]
MRYLEFFNGRGRLSALLFGLVLSAGLFACGPTGDYIWVDSLPSAQISGPDPADYVIVPGDLLNIRVYNQEAMSTRARVRPDGKIFIPLVGDVDVKGRRPAELAKELEARMKSYIVAPSVAVTAEEVQPVRVSVIGEVARPGALDVQPGTSILQALAMSGGLTEFADEDSIFVLRTAPKQALQRIRFDYDALTRGAGKGPAFALRPGDVVVVE